MNVSCSERGIAVFQLKEGERLYASLFNFWKRVSVSSYVK